MSDKIDVQLGLDYVGITIPDDGILDIDQFNNLRDLVNEAWLNMFRLQPVAARAEDLKQGDIIPSLGVTVAMKPHWTDTGGTHVDVFLNDHQGGLTLPVNLEMTVHRRIS